MTVESHRVPAFAAWTVHALGADAGVPRRARRRRVVGAWTAAWGGAAAIGVANAALRETAFNDLSDLRAHQLSTITLLVFLTAYMWAVERWQPLPSTPTAVRVGVAWAGLTVLFEFTLGVVVTRRPLSELLGAYNLAAGRLWALVPVWMAVGPLALRRLRRSSA